MHPLQCEKLYDNTRYQGLARDQNAAIAHSITCCPFVRADEVQICWPPDWFWAIPAIAASDDLADKLAQVVSIHILDERTVEVGWQAGDRLIVVIIRL